MEDVIIELYESHWIIVGTHFVVESPMSRVIVGVYEDIRKRIRTEFTPEEYTWMRKNGHHHETHVVS